MAQKPSREERLESLRIEALANNLVAKALEPVVLHALEDMRTAEGTGEYSFWSGVWRSVKGVAEDYRKSADNVARDADLISGLD